MKQNIDYRTAGENNPQVSKLVRMLLETGMESDEIAKATGLTVEEVEAL